jgi:putative CocE/NonD family hydrolase
MADAVRSGEGWRVSPADYAKTRPATFAVSPPRSLYVTMRDGCRLALDVYLPQSTASSDAPRSKLPTLLILTPYYRRFKLKPGAPATTEPSPNAGKWRDLFVPRGYAVVVCDVRGTGASFGTRDSFRSPAEREDYRQIAEWIVRQAWSDGSIGSTGISYVGAAADFLASTGHPAVKAVAPLFAVWDTYSDHYYPGGLLLNRLAETYDELMIALDQDRRDLLGKFAYFKDPNFDGPQPVDDDPEGGLARAAIAEHQSNFRMTEFIREFRFKDDALASDPAVTPASFSPYGYCAGVGPDVAVYSVSGWYDGAGYANGGIARFLTLPNPKRHLLLGPWDHGARINGSPWRAQPEPEFPLLGEVLRFFDQYLMGLPTGLDREAPVHYFAMHEERWHAADTWPPPATAQSLYLAAPHRLTDEPAAPASDSYATPFAFGTGNLTRYERIAALDTREYYADWHGRDTTLLVYTSQPLRQPQTLAGHALVTLWLEADQPDAAIHVYLEEVEADGRCRYVTEGMLRALHRKTTPCPDHHKTTWPWRTFARADAATLPQGEPVEMTFALLPVAWKLEAGSRVRLAIAGGDRDHVVQVPHGRPPRLRIHHGRAHPSRLVLPVAGVRPLASPIA